MSSLRLHFLGRPRLERGGQPVDLPSAKAVALLAYLSLRNSAEPRDRLLGLLWAESTEDAARKNLRNTLWTIRKNLGEGVLDAGEDRVGLNDEVWVDVREFERAAQPNSHSPSAAGHAEFAQGLERAIGLYTGSLADGLNVSDAPEFENWLSAERERLGQMCLRLMAALLDEHRAAGEWQMVVRVAERALALDELQEPIYRALMEARARLGERAEALRHYDALKSVLARELDVAPLAETEALRAAIARGDLAAPPATRPPERWARPPLQRDASLPPFVGREEELRALDEAYAAAASNLQAVLLTGELGIGKSRLWQEWSAALPAETAVLECRCVEATQSLPFAPLADLFRSPAVALRLFTPGSPVPAIWLGEVTRLLPEIRASVPDLPQPLKLPPDEERRRVFEAFSQCVFALSAGAVVLFVDDLHWADRATLEWLGYLTYRARDRQLLFVSAYRPEDAPAAVATLVAEWGRDGLLRRLPLARLTADEAAALVAGLADVSKVDAAQALRAQAQGAGNPYITIELCRAAPGDVPAALTELVRARLDRLPEGARQVVQAAGVLEPEFDFTLLRSVSGRDEAETLDALDALLNAAVLVERGSVYTFAHPLLASVVRDGLSGARRTFLYRRAAEAVESEYAGRLPHAAGRLSEYYARAGLPGQAAAYAEMAGQRALGLASTAEAVEFYRKACALESTPGRLAGLGYALHRAGDLSEAPALLEAAIQGFEAQGDRRGAARAYVTLQDSNLRAGRVDEILRWSDEGLAYLSDDTDPETLARAHHLLGAAIIHARRPLAEAEFHQSEAARLAAENNLDEVAARSRFALGNVRAERGDLAGAVKAFREVAAMARDAGDPFHEIMANNNAAYHAVLLGDLEAAHEHARRGMALAEEYALPVVNQWLFSTKGEIALAEKQWDEAETWFTRGLAEAERNDNLEMVAGCRANLGQTARGRGDLDRALVLLEEARRIAPALQLRTQIDLWLAELHLERGERAAAEEALGRAEAQLADEGRQRLRPLAERLRGEITARGEAGPRSRKSRARSRARRR